MGAAARELRALSTDYLPDGRRGLDRSHDPERDPALTTRLLDLFHRVPASLHSCGGRRLVPLHSSPNVYLVQRFLSARELEHLDAVVTRRRAAFRQSQTDDAAAPAGGTKTLRSSERTSLSLALPKGADSTLRAIEARAAEIVGLPPDHVEPLQLVHYSHGQQFGLHHDLGDLRLAGDPQSDGEEGVHRKVGGSNGVLEAPDAALDDESGVERSVRGVHRKVGGSNGVLEGADAALDDESGVERRVRGVERRVGGSKAVLEVSTAGLEGSTKVGSSPSGWESSPSGGQPRYEATCASCGMWVGSPAGPRRLVTLFVYLNTLPEGVGHTEFPAIDLSVRPSCGDALLFCNVLADGRPDARVAHRANPVPEGMVKFGCNVWITDCTMQAHVLHGSSLPRANSKSVAKRRPAGGILSALLEADLAAINHAPPSALIGLELLKGFGEQGIFRGTVISHDALCGFRLLYDDGDVEDLDFETLATLRLSDANQLVGRRVSKHFPGCGRFGGAVKEYCPERAYLVRYDDGDEEHLGARDLLSILTSVKNHKRRRKR